MSQAMSKPGLALTEHVDEVVGIFPTTAALEEAISQLTLAGFDRADISLPLVNSHSASPEASAANPNTPTDQQQMRTIHTSMAGTVGALAAAGVTIATGGAAALAIGAAVVAGTGAGLLANAASTAGDVSNTDTESRHLSVRVISATKAMDARNAMTNAGAISVSDIVREMKTSGSVG